MSELATTFRNALRWSDAALNAGAGGRSFLASAADELAAGAIAAQPKHPALARAIRDVAVTPIRTELARLGAIGAPAASADVPVRLLAYVGRQAALSAAAVEGVRLASSISPAVARAYAGPGAGAVDDAMRAAFSAV